MPTFNKVDMMNCCQGFHDMDDDTGECRVCGYSEDDSTDHVNQSDTSLAHLKLAAIRARIRGVWDHPALVVFGELSTNALDDIMRFLDSRDPRGPEWSGSPDPNDPDNFWIDDATGERINAHTGERSPA